MIVRFEYRLCENSEAGNCASKSRNLRARESRDMDKEAEKMISALSPHDRKIWRGVFTQSVVEADSRAAPGETAEMAALF